MVLQLTSIKTMNVFIFLRLFVLFSFAFFMVKNQQFEKFYKTYVQEADLFNAESFKVSYFQSIHLCSAWAARQDLPLFCFSQDNSCKVARFAVHPLSNDPHLPGMIECYTIYTPDDCFYDNTTMKQDGEIWNETGICKSWKKCQKRKISVITEGEEECPTGYTIYPNLGCVKTHNKKLTWPDARQCCQEEGGDLVTYNAGWETNNGPLDNYLKSLFAYWIGLYRANSTSWNWTVSGLSSLTNEAPNWLSGYPDATEGIDCVYFHAMDETKFIVNRNCTSKLSNYVCKILTP